MLAPYKGRVFDPCCGSGGMFVQSEKFVESHGGRIGDISIYGQESNYTTWRLAMMNMAIRGIEAHIAWNEQGSFHNDAFKDFKADYHPGQSAVQRQRLGRRPAARTTCAGNSACRLPATPTLPGCNISSITCRRPAWLASFWPTAACRPINPAKAKSAKPSSKPIWWIAWSRCRDNCFTPRKFPSASGFFPATSGTHRFKDRRGKVLFIDARKIGTHG